MIKGFVNSMELRTMVNSPDEHVRSIAYDVISRTIHIEFYRLVRKYGVITSIGDAINEAVDNTIKELTDEKVN